MADSIDPESYSEDLTGVGDSVTITKTVTINEEVTSAKIDLFFLTDTTGSMGALINSVKNSASAILSATSSLGDVAYGVGEYRDIYDTYSYRLNTDITIDTAAVQTGINAYSANGGGDWEEANLYALNQVATTSSWRDDSTRILIWFGDAPGHDPRNGVTEAEAIASLLGKNITVEAMNTGSLDYTGQATRITTATGGTYYSSINTSAIVDEIKDSIESIFEEYSTVSLGVVGADNVAVTIGPLDYTGDYDRTVERTFTFDVTFTGLSEGVDEITINALVDGGIVATEYDTITVPPGGSPVPEPATMLLFGIGILGIAGISRKS